MISLSNIIKSENVFIEKSVSTLLGEEHKKAADLLRGHESGVRSKVGYLLNHNARETTEIIFKNAYRKVQEIEHQKRIKSELVRRHAFENGDHQGFSEGFDAGYHSGSDDGVNIENSKMADTCTEMSLGEQQCIDKLTDIAEQCIESAFSLAQAVLNTSIDREAPEFADLIKDARQMPGHRDVVLEIGGRKYDYQSRFPEILEKVSGGCVGVELNAASPETSLSDRAGLEWKPDSGIKPLQQFCDEQSAEENILPLPDEQTQKTVPAELLNRPESAYDERLEQVSRYEAGSDGTEPAETEEAEVEEDIGNASDEAGISDDEGGTVVPAEKFVFVQPRIKKARFEKAGEHSGNGSPLNEIENLDTDEIKALIKKANINEIVTVLSGMDTESVEAVIAKCTRKMQEKIRDGLKYLKPVK